MRMRSRILAGYAGERSAIFFAPDKGHLELAAKLPCDVAGRSPRRVRVLPLNRNSDVGEKFIAFIVLLSLYKIYGHERLKSLGDLASARLPEWRREAARPT